MKMNQIEIYFNKINTHKIGHINFHEFTTFCEDYFNVNNTKENLISMNIFYCIFKLCVAKKVSENKEEHISSNEIKRINDSLQFEQNLSTNRMIGTFLFNIINVKRNGTISEKELFKFSSLIGVDEEKNREFMKELDNNKDGFVDLNEFLEWYTYGLSEPIQKYNEKNKNDKNF